MTRRTPSIHWLRENAQERSPYRLLVIDTETRPAGPDDPDRQVLRLWSACLIRRHGADPRKPRAEWFRGRTAAELADLVADLARADRTLWAVTHNLAFDLAVTELPVLLTERGWTVTESALTTDSPWCRMAHRSRRLLIADTFSWFPTSVAELGALVGRRKLPLPDPAATDAEWWDRCDRDVVIVARAITSAMDWWDAGHLGNWSITGPATGWSSYRHRRPAPRVLVDPDPVARAWEMRAVTGGRKEVRQLGRLPAGLYADLDIATAHLTAMAGLHLPFRRIAHFDHLEPDDVRLHSTILDVMATAEVEVQAPRYPWDSGRGTFYPVGRFHAQLAGPELREAISRGELRSIGPGYTYQVSPHMTDWALWLAGLLADDNLEVPPAVRLLAKHWSRCVPGKWAGHTSDVVARVPDRRPGWAVEQLVIMPERRPADLLLIGGERWTIVRDEWADDAFPAILAWIQSATRVAMSRLVDILGPAILTLNTDGALVDVARVLAVTGHAALASTSRHGPQLQELDALCQLWDPVLDPFSIRIKRAARRVAVISPQHLILDDERRLAGVPARAIALAGGRYTFTQWPKLRVQLARPHAPGYRTVEATVDLAHVPPTGWLRESGRVDPVTVLQVDGRDTLQDAPGDPDGTRGALAPIEKQHPVLRPFLAAREAVA